MQVYCSNVALAIECSVLKRCCRAVFFQVLNRVKLWASWFCIMKYVQRELKTGILVYGDTALVRVSSLVLSSRCTYFIRFKCL